MTNEHLQIASKLVNEEINIYNDRYAQSPQAADYVMRRVDDDGESIAVQPTHSTCAYCFDRLIKIAEVLKLHYYFDVQDNLDGKPAPTLKIF